MVDGLKGRSAVYFRVSELVRSVFGDTYAYINKHKYIIVPSPVSPSNPIVFGGICTPIYKYRHKSTELFHRTINQSLTIGLKAGLCLCLEGSTQLYIIKHKHSDLFHLSFKGLQACVVLMAHEAGHTHEVEIFSSMESYRSPFKLSELLCGTKCINTLALDFQGQKIWLQPEKNQLHSAFSNLRALSLQGIFVGFGLLWTITLLEAAHYLEILHVEVCDHICIGEEERNELYGERTNVPWEMCGCEDFSKCLPIKELRLDGFSANEDHITFIGAVMERASNLQSVVLEEQYCKKCIAICVPTTTSKCKFPKKGDEQEMVANSLRSRFSPCAQIIFNDYKFFSD